MRKEIHNKQFDNFFNFVFLLSLNEFFRLFNSIAEFFLEDYLLSFLKSNVVGLRQMTHDWKVRLVEKRKISWAVIIPRMSKEVFFLMFWHIISYY